MNIEETSNNDLLEVLANRGYDARRIKDFTKRELVEELKTRTGVETYVNLVVPATILRITN